MAETVARRGGIGVLPQDIPVEVMHRGRMAYVQAASPGLRDADHPQPSDTVAEALALIHKRAHVRGGGGSTSDEPVGIFTEPTTAASTGSRSCTG